MDRNVRVQPALCRAEEKSPSAKRAWIEMAINSYREGRSRVALCEEGVDRNNSMQIVYLGNGVALCEEGVDRNHARLMEYGGACVALCEEGVDRNRYFMHHMTEQQMSPSAKRAWIEISPLAAFYSSGNVALCEEGVDRNCNLILVLLDPCTSPSAKRAWIEIL